MQELLQVYKSPLKPSLSLQSFELAKLTSMSSLGKFLAIGVSLESSFALVQNNAERQQETEASSQKTVEPVKQTTGQTQKPGQKLLLTAPESSLSGPDWAAIYYKKVVRALYIWRLYTNDKKINDDDKKTLRDRTTKTIQDALTQKNGVGREVYRLLMEESHKSREIVDPKTGKKTNTCLQDAEKLFYLEKKEKLICLTWQDGTLYGSKPLPNPPALLHAAKENLIPAGSASPPNYIPADNFPDPETNPVSVNLEVDYFCGRHGTSEPSYCDNQGHLPMKLQWEKTFQGFDKDSGSPDDIANARLWVFLGVFTVDAIWDPYGN